MVQYLIWYMHDLMVVLFEKKIKNQTVNIKHVNEVFGGPLIICIHLRHSVNYFDGEDLFDQQSIS
jgi:acyl-ACP thioesterase